MSTISFDAKLAHFNSILAQYNISPITNDRDVDHALYNFTTMAEVEEFASDLANDLATERAESRHFAKHGY